MPITRFLMDPNDGTDAATVQDLLGGTGNNNTTDTNQSSTTEGGNGEDDGTITEELTDQERNASIASQANSITEKAITIYIKSLNSNKAEIAVRGSIENYSDSFSVATTSDAAYGRIDPITTYTGTTRTISFSILIDTSLAAVVNRNTGLNVAKKIASILYPSYSDPMGTSLDTSTLKAPPLVRIRWENVIHDVVGYITSFSYDINTDRGTTLVIGNSGNLENQPAGVTINISFQPLHTKEGGFGSTGGAKSSNWPI